MDAHAIATAPTSDDATAVAPEAVIYDVLIAGGGTAGVLTAARLAAAHPGLRIALLDQGRTLGGRMRTSSPEDQVHGYGLSAGSDDLFGVWQQALRELGASAEDLTALPIQRQQHLGVLASGRIVQQEIQEWFTPKGARLLGGLTASRQWGEVEDILRQGASAAGLAKPVSETSARSGAVKGSAPEGNANTDDDQDDDPEEVAAARSHAFSHYWKQPRKAPAAIVLEHFASAVGIPDVWGAATAALADRAAFHGSRLHSGSWAEMMAILVAQPAFAEAVHIEMSNRLLHADFEGGLWTIAAEKGAYRARSLVVAQSPWQAAQWLKRSLWPTQLLQLASKTKPVSMVVLTERLLFAEDVAHDLPDVTIVPAERVQIIRSGERELCFQATIDYELSLQAPAVIKAVKALKRARKKLQQIYPETVSESGHVALLPVAWAQSPVHSDRRYLERLDKKSYQTPTLAFCGDAYGARYDGDANLIQSVFLASAAIGSSIESVARPESRSSSVDAAPDVAP